MSTILRNNTVKIRKPHICWGCAKQYETGTIMNVTVDTHYGIENVYWCKTCSEYMKNYFDFDDEFGFGDIFANDQKEWNRIYNELNIKSEVKK